MDAQKYTKYTLGGNYMLNEDFHAIPRDEPNTTIEILVNEKGKIIGEKEENSSLITPSKGIFRKHIIGSKSLYSLHLSPSHLARSKTPQKGEYLISSYLFKKYISQLPIIKIERDITFSSSLFREHQYK